MAQQKYSYSSNATKNPYVYETITDRLKSITEKNPDKTALIYYSLTFERSTISRKDLLEQSLNFASNLIEIGVKKNDLILVGLKNSIEICIALFGVMFSGGIQYHVSPNKTDGSEILGLINETNSKYLILDEESEFQNISKYKNLVKIMLLKKPIDSNIVYDENNIFDFNKFKGNFNKNVIFPLLLPEDDAIYFSTSGSTGKKKMAAYSHFYLLNNSLISSETLGAIDEHDIHFNDRPIPWTVGFPRMLLSHGSTRIIVDTRLTLAGIASNKIFDIISKERCTIVYLPCYLIYDFLYNKPDISQFNSVRVIYTAGQKIRKNYSEVINKYCKKFFVWYGTTEISTVSIFQDDNSDSYEDGIIGKPMFGSEMKVVDENFNVVPVGEKGMLMTRNMLRFTNYKHRECNCGAQPVMNNYWYETGDIAHIRGDGNFIVHGRHSDVVKVGPVRYMPDSIECHYLKYPGVKHAFIINVFDERLIDALCLCVVSDEDKIIKVEELENYSNEIFVDQSFLSGQSIKPKYFVIFDKLPLNENGKISRKIIQEEAMSKLNLNK